MPNHRRSSTCLPLPLCRWPFVLIVLWANRSKKLSAGLAIGGIGAVLDHRVGDAFTTFGIEGFGEHPFRMFRNWLPTGTTWQAFGFAVDPLTAAMLFMVPFVCFLIFVYAVGYMGVGKPRGRCTTSAASRPSRATSIRWPAASSPTSRSSPPACSAWSSPTT